MLITVAQVIYSLSSPLLFHVTYGGLSPSNSQHAISSLVFGTETAFAKVHSYEVAGDAMRQWQESQRFNGTLIPEYSTVAGH